MKTGKLTVITGKLKTGGSGFRFVTGERVSESSIGFIVGIPARNNTFCADHYLKGLSGNPVINRNSMIEGLTELF